MLAYTITTLALISMVGFAESTPPESTAEGGIIRGRPTTLITPDNSWVLMELEAELGFLIPAAHTIQFGSNGTKFNYVTEGGQNNLFLFLRLKAGTVLGGRHRLALLYQPLDIGTRVLLRRDVTFDDQVFPQNSQLETRYGFSFWRLSYFYDFSEDPESELAFGLGLQLRNATIDFESGDGNLFRSSRNIGPVPLLGFRARYDLVDGLWMAGEIEGFYAPIKVLNGGESDVEGAIVDLSLRAGLYLEYGLQPFFNIRYLGGGASGTSKNDPPPGDGFTDNWLHFVTLSLGFLVQ